MNEYEAMWILDIQGKEEGVAEMIGQLEKVIKSCGGTLKNTQKMGRKKFESVAGRLDAGYYLGANIEMEPSKLDSLRQKLALNEKVYRQFYTCAKSGQPTKEQAAKAAA